MTDCGVLFLAAGRGRRSGGPKAWHEYQGKPLLAHHIDFLRTALHIDDIAISIQAGWEDRCRVLDARADWVVVDPDAPALASLIALIDTVKSGGRGHLRRFVYHVDMPLWDAGVFKRLNAPVAGSGEHMGIVPVFSGRRGHPVLLSPLAQDAVSRLDGQRDRLDSWLRSVSVLEVDAGSSVVLENWNSDIT
ncbi:MAG: NTP transferase domain-containing protein [Elusimicrobiota bacterium]